MPSRCPGAPGARVINPRTAHRKNGNCWICNEQHRDHVTLFGAGGRRRVGDAGGINPPKPFGAHPINRYLVVTKLLTNIFKSILICIRQSLLYGFQNFHLQITNYLNMQEKKSRNHGLCVVLQERPLYVTSVNCIIHSSRMEPHTADVGILTYVVSNFSNFKNRIHTR